MKQFVKFKGGELVHPPKFYNNIINYDRNEKALIKDGWKEYIIEPSEIEPTEGKMLYTYYEETDTTIIAKTGLKDIEIPEKSDYEKIEELKTKLTDTDYKIIKCSEYQLAGKELPYDIAELHAERQALRDEINILEESVIIDV
jgi:hypothetical protein